jgi:hypothetical protein
MRGSTSYTLGAVGVVGAILLGVVVLTRGSARSDHEPVEIAQAFSTESAPSSRLEARTERDAKTNPSSGAQIGKGPAGLAVTAETAASPLPEKQSQHPDAEGKAATPQDDWLKELRSLEEEHGWFRNATGKEKTRMSTLLLGRSIAVIRDAAGQWVADEHANHPARAFPEWDEDQKLFIVKLESRRYSFEAKEFPEVGEVLTAWPNPINDELIDKVEARAQEALTILRKMTRNVPK